MINSGHLFPLEGKLLGAVIDKDGTAQELRELADGLVARDKTNVAIAVSAYAARLANDVILPSAASQVRDLIQAEDLQIAACLASGTAERSAGNYQAALAQLEHCWTLAQSRGQETLELCLEMGLVLSHFASRRTQAIQALQRGLDLQLAIDSGAEINLQLSNALVEAHHQAGQWDEAERMCRKLVATWKACPYTLQLLCTYFLLADSRSYLEKREKGGVKIEEWASALTTEGTLSQWLWHFVSADLARYGQNAELGLTISQEPAESSYITACATRWQALSQKGQGKLESAESTYRKACDMYQAHYAETLDFAICLNSLGTLYEQMSKLELAEKKFTAAIQLYSAHYPETMEHANCLNSLGQLYTVKKRPIREIEDIYQCASRIYSASCPQALGFAACLGNLGYLYSNELNEAFKAEDKFVKACDLYAVRSPLSPNYGICLLNLANLYESNARKRYQQALELFTARNSQSSVKKCQDALNRLSRKG